MKVQMISDYDKCYKLIQELKLIAGKFKQCMLVNNQRRIFSGENGDHERVTIKKKPFCGPAENIDAEHYYREKID